VDSLGSPVINVDFQQPIDSRYFLFLWQLDIIIIIVDVVVVAAVHVLLSVSYCICLRCISCTMSILNLNKKKSNNWIWESYCRAGVGHPSHGGPGSRCGGRRRRPASAVQHMKYSAPSTTDAMSRQVRPTSLQLLAAPPPPPPPLPYSTNYCLFLFIRS